MQGKLALATEFAGAYPEQAARVLEEMLPADSSAFIDAVPDKQSGVLLSSMLPYHAGKCIQNLAVEAAARYLGSVDPKIAAGILKHVHEARSEAILEIVPRRRAAQISILLSYSQSMIGAWLEPNVLTLPEECAISEARTRLQNEEYADFHRVYVEDSDRNLKGFVRLVRLIAGASDRPLASIVEPCPAVLKASMSLQSALADEAWYWSDYLPVLDRSQKFLGVLRYAVLRTAASITTTTTAEYSATGTFLDLAENCYLGLADVMTASLSIDEAAKEGELSND